MKHMARIKGNCFLIFWVYVSMNWTCARSMEKSERDQTSVKQHCNVVPSIHMMNWRSPTLRQQLSLAIIKTYRFMCWILRWLWYVSDFTLTCAYFVLYPSVCIINLSWPLWSFSHDLSWVVYCMQNQWISTRFRLWSDQKFNIVIMTRCRFCMV